MGSFIAALALPVPDARLLKEGISPQKLIKVSMLHILENHDEWVTVHTHPVKLHNVLVLQIGEEFSFSLEVLSGRQSRVFQGLWKKQRNYIWKKSEAKLHTDAYPEQT